MSDTSTLHAIILGFLQGTAEFLPISSSGHLILASYFMDGKPLPLALNVALHVGTLLAILLYFWRDWMKIANCLVKRITQKEKSFESDVLFPALLIGSIPAAVVGLLWEEDIERIFHSPQYVVVPLALVGILLWWGDRKAPTTRPLNKLTFKDSILIGVFQACALIPGVSRSGSTILGGRLLGFSRTDAARYSFLLGTPAMAGAALLKRKEILESFNEPSFFVGCMTALLVGCLAISFLMAFIKRYGFGVFALYRVGLAVTIIVLLV